MSTAYLSRVLPVPVGDEVVELSLDDLPADIEDYVQVLREERCPPPFWLKLASECGARKRKEDCEAVLLSALQTLSNVPPPDRPYRSQQAIAEEVAPFHAMLNSVQLDKARTCPKLILPDAKYQNLLSSSPQLNSKDQLLQQAGNHAKAIVFPPPPPKGSNQRQQSSSLRTSLLIGRGVYLTSTGNTEDALKAFKVVLDRQKRNPIALLGSACCLLRKREYSSALTMYQEVLRISIAQSARAAKESAIVGPDGELVENLASKWLGPDPRVGIGLCLQGLGRLNDARRAWTKAISMNPNNPAPHLLLGLSKINMAKDLADLPVDLASLAPTEAEARSLVYAEGLNHIQISWKLDNKNAMTAIALAEHFSVRALSTSSTNKLEAQQEYERAMKLGEHAIQYADNRAAVNQAWLIFARTAHLYSFLDESSTNTVELRSIAQRYYTRVVEDLGPRVTAAAVADSSPLPSGYILAILGLAQLQVSRGEALGAMNTLDPILARPASTSSSCLELTLLAGSLRAHSHPGASIAEQTADRKKARLLLDRALRSIEACGSGVKTGSEDLQQVDSLFEEATSGQVAESPALALARTRLATEALGQVALKAIFSLVEDGLAYVQMADLYQQGVDGQGSDFGRAIQSLTQALRAIEVEEKDNKEEIQEDNIAVTDGLAIRLRCNLGALLGLQGMESTGDLSAQSLNASINQLQIALSTAGKAKNSSSLDAEKTTALYNLGRILEASGSVEEAQKAYDAVLANHPEYVDAKVRQALLIACAPSARGNKEATQFANTLFKEALSSDPVNLDTRSAFVCFLSGELPASPNPPQWESIKENIAQLFMGPNSSQAVQLFGGAGAAKAVNDEARHDAYTLSALAWAYYNIGHSVKVGNNSKSEKLRALLRCCDLLDKALNEDKQCAFAMQGMAILLAEGSMVDLISPSGNANPIDLDNKRRKAAEEALVILTKLREVDDGVSVHICMGHAYIAREDYNRAVKSYELAAKREPAKPSLLQYLSKATFHLGMATKSYQLLQTSIDHLYEAITLLEKRTSASAAAEVKYLRYNVAVTRQKMLQMLFEIKIEERDLSTLEKAQKGVEESQTIFSELTQDAKDGKLSYITGEMIEQRHAYGATSLLKQVASHIVEQKQYEEDTREKREAAAARKREREEALEKERLEQEEQDRLKAEKLAEERRAAIEEARTWEYYQNDVEEKAKKPRKSTGGGGGGKRKKNKKKRKDEEGASEIESSESEPEAQYGRESEDDDMIVSDEAEIEQGDLSDNEIERKKESRAEKKAAKKEEKAARKKEKRARKESKASKSEDNSESEDRPAKKPKKAKMRRAVQEDLIDSDEEV